MWNTDNPSMRGNIEFMTPARLKWTMSKEGVAFTVQGVSVAVMGLRMLGFAAEPVEVVENALAAFTASPSRETLLWVADALDPLTMESLQRAAAVWKDLALKGGKTEAEAEAFAKAMIQQSLAAGAAADAAIDEAVE